MCQGFANHNFPTYLPQPLFSPVCAGIRWAGSNCGPPGDTDST